MGTITVVNHLSLDGVMQAPERADEDVRGGFAHGGWAASRNDAVMGATLGAGMAKGGALLLGRRTYEDFYGFWPSQQGNPFTEALNHMQKYVASTTLTAPLPWVNSTLLQGDVADAVARLKDESDVGLTIMGSGVLIESLMHRNLIDTYMLLIHPVVLGSGRRLFREGGALADLELNDSVTTTTGVVIATYQART